MTLTLSLKWQRKINHCKYSNALIQNSSDSIYNQPENPFISRSKFKSNRKNLFFENSEQFKDKSEASPEFDANRLTAWLEKSEKVS